MEDTTTEVEAGRELDAQVAAQVMGWVEVGWRKETDRDYWGCPPWGTGDPRRIPYYSMDLAAAWEVVEHFRAQDWIYELGSTFPEGGHYCLFLRPYDEGDEAVSYMRAMTASSDTAPLAICRSALATANTSPQ